MILVSSLFLESLRPDPASFRSVSQLHSWALGWLWADKQHVLVGQAPLNTGPRTQCGKHLTNANSHARLASHLTEEKGGGDSDGAHQFPEVHFQLDMSQDIQLCHIKHNPQDKDRWQRTESIMQPIEEEIPWGMADRWDGCAKQKKHGWPMNECSRQGGWRSHWERRDWRETRLVQGM